MTTIERVATHPEKLVRWFDDRQVERTWLGLPVAVVRQYADDCGSALVGLVTFLVFLGMLPQLVVLLTVFGRLLEGSEGLRDSVLDSALAQLPVVGARLRDDVTALQASGLALAVSLAGLLWTAAGIYHSLQLALNQVWNVEGVGRQGFVSRHVRAFLLFGLIVAAAGATAGVRTWSPPDAVPGALALVLEVLGGIALAGVVLLAAIRTW